MDKIAALSEILAANPADAFARYGLALAYDQQGDTTRALAEFTTLVAQHPDYTPAFQMAGQILLRTGDTARARDFLTRGLAAAQRTSNSHAASEISGLLDELPPES
jgi:predicted Zn-dependent protease